MSLTPRLLVADDWSDYALLDSGDGRKLEQIGPYRVIRPESQALWPPAWPVEQWSADAVFLPKEGDAGGNWQIGPQLPASWTVEYQGLPFVARCTPFRHLGFFPEQSVHWRWIANMLRERPSDLGAGPLVLNLFGYSGLTTLIAASNGAQVTHVDASKKAIGYAVENQDQAGLSHVPIRWIVDDAMKFVRREARRGRRYDGIILDPPKFGRGPKGEIWKFQEQLPELLSVCRSLLAPVPLFFILTAYAVHLSPIALHGALAFHMKGMGGHIDVGDMALPEQSAGRLLPTAIFARWGNIRAPLGA